MSSPSPFGDSPSPRLLTPIQVPANRLPRKRVPAGGRVPFVRPPEADLVIATSPIAFSCCLLGMLPTAVAGGIAQLVLEALYIAMLVSGAF
jgi:hypothetical protein